jgi:transposase
MTSRRDRRHRGQPRPAAPALRPGDRRSRLRPRQYRRELWRRGVQPLIARRSTEHGSGLGRVRWVVERTFAWLHNFRRLRIRWGTRRRPALRASEPRMLADLLAAYPTVTHKRGSLLGCMELDSDGGAAAFPQMQERDGRRSRAGRRLVLVRSDTARASAGATAAWRKESRGDASAVRTFAPYRQQDGGTVETPACRALLHALLQPRRRARKRRLYA